MRTSITLALLAALLIIGMPGQFCTAAQTAEPRASIDISGHPFKGPADAPVTLVVFSDYL
jgi:protein-disulfide isomerase